jgi:4a-hydroxytetrahydrobiopterin dehydratase
MAQAQRLVGERCVACQPDSPHVTDADIEELHPQVPEWEMIRESGVRKLRRRFAFDDFNTALEFANGVGEIADAEDHHPRITIEWGRALVTWSTHAIKDLHRNDFIMAAKTDQVYRTLVGQDVQR